jgi:predicted nucleotidyltransferase
VLREIVRLAERTGQLDSIYVFGSFVTSKEEPADLDIFLVMTANFSVSMAEGRAKPIFERSRAAIVFGACIYWITARTDPSPFLEAWQKDRDGNLKGIVEVVR